MLRPFGPDDLAVVRPWFEDRETMRWLGGSDWPSQLLRLTAPQAGRQGFLYLAGGRPVVLLDVEIDEDARAGFALVTDPDRRGEGHAAAAIRALAAHPFLDGANELLAGIERGNEASRRLMNRLGFTERAGGPDADGFTYHAMACRPSGRNLSCIVRKPGA